MQATGLQTIDLISFLSLKNNVCQFRKGEARLIYPYAVTILCASMAGSKIANDLMGNKMFSAGGCFL